MTQLTGELIGMKTETGTCNSNFQTIRYGITGLSVSALALTTVISTTAVAFATINNTVTVTGSSPSGSGDVSATADETVDVEDAAPDMTVTKTADVTADVAVGDTVTYTYTVTNTGNVTLSNVSLSESHEGSGTDPVPLNENLTTGTDSTDVTANDGVWSSLVPGETVTWTGTYVVTQTDLEGQVDNDIDNTVTASATPAAGTFAGGPFTATEEVDLEDVLATLSVTKVADNDTNRAAGDLVTYTYTVTNTGNVPISAISLADVVTAGSGTPPTPVIDTLTNTSGNSIDDGLDNVFDLLYMGDVVTFTGTYTVTQDDVDNLQ